MYILYINKIDNNLEEEIFYLVYERKKDANIFGCRERERVCVYCVCVRVCVCERERER